MHPARSVELSGWRLAASGWRLGEASSGLKDYTDDACMNTFTAGQAARADTQTQTYQ